MEIGENCEEGWAPIEGLCFNGRVCCVRDSGGKAENCNGESGKCVAKWRVKNEEDRVSEECPGGPTRCVKQDADLWPLSKYPAALPLDQQQQSNPSQSNESGSNQPETDESDSSQPETDESDSSQPENDESDSSEPENGGSGPNEPETDESDSSQPETDESDSSQPETDESSDQSDSSQPNSDSEQSNDSEFDLPEISEIPTDVPEDLDNQQKQEYHTRITQIIERLKTLQQRLG